MLFLDFIGSSVLSAIGGARFIGLYLMGGLSSSVLHLGYNLLVAHKDTRMFAAIDIYIYIVIVIYCMSF